MNTDQESTVVLGPFLGDFQNEVQNFRPYVYWIKENVKYKNFYVATYENRKFLYSDCNTDLCIPSTVLLDNEHSQFNFINQLINKKEFEIISKNIKSSVIKKENTQKKFLKPYNLSYSPNQTQSYYQKYFTDFGGVEEIRTSDVLVIPSIVEDISVYYNLFEFFEKKNIKYNIIGDKNIHFYDKNIVTNSYETDYKTIFSYIKGAKIVLAPISYWTYITNLMGNNIFSWGTHIANYRNDGIYRFSNDNSYTFMYNSYNQNIKILLKQIERYLGDIEE